MASFSQFGTTAWAPFRIEPTFSERVWGVRDLHPWYDCAAGDGEPIGEAWLTGDHCKVSTGVHAGRTLGELFATNSRELLGASAPGGASPLLIKVIFAREKLSVQVHPDDRMAQKYGEPRGKTECWYALEAEPGAQVACGLKPGVTLDQVKAGIETDTLERSLSLLDVNVGDMIFVDAGTVHAIWPGSILLETQQNCDLTYRMYDYGRGRELHIAKSLEATRLVTHAGKITAREAGDRTILIEGDYFRVERFEWTGSVASSALPGKDELNPGLAYLFAVRGSARITGPGFEAIELAKGAVAAVPAASPEFAVENAEELGRSPLELMRITPRWPG